MKNFGNEAIQLNLILKYAIEIDASDIHITENKVSWVRAMGNLHKCGEPISISDIDEFKAVYQWSVFQVVLLLS